jgi:hypothetical protein
VCPSAAVKIDLLPTTTSHLIHCLTSTRVFVEHVCKVGAKLSKTAVTAILFFGLKFYI